MSDIRKLLDFYDLLPHCSVDGQNITWTRGKKTFLQDNMKQGTFYNDNDDDETL
jgi:hypothetical protein